MDSLIETPKTSTRVWLARGIAVVADILQIAVFPATVEGAFSPLNDGIDLVVAVLMILLVGWHIALVPSIVVKMLPFADLAPTWTLAVLYVTRGRAAVESSTKITE